MSAYPLLRLKTIESHLDNINSTFDMPFNQNGANSTATITTYNDVAGNQTNWAGGHTDNSTTTTNTNSNNKTVGDITGTAGAGTGGDGGGAGTGGSVGGISF
ncbi:unnamed protein product [Cyclocybe aegerita]|uniref:Uncharacterized protein n=1 Tax=Cyclocybe aegerita TaxID=1973307 RepID=A0A8S0WP37_CYCAE|nr:unnamed protein product [Cyclocybe aegerita]